jgi:peptidyl-prolyl cis-trans isomerase D
MFDLFRSREKSVRILLGALLLLVALSMLTYLVPNYNTGGAARADQVVASVGSTDITVAEVQHLIQNALRGKQLPPELVATYVPQVVDQMVTDRALSYEAARMGLTVSDQDLRDAIQQNFPNLFPDGKFVGKDIYAAMLAQQDLSIPQFEDDLRRQVLIAKLRDIAMEGTIVTPGEIQNAYKLKNEKLKIQYVKIPADKYKTEAQPTQAEVENYFKVNQGQYRDPEKKNLVILIADQNQIAQGLNPTDTDLHAMYNQNMDQFRTKERVHARHILLMTQGKPPADDAKIRAQAEDLLKQIKAGANFEELAKKYSQDPGSASKGGDLGWVEHGQMVPEFDKTCFSLKPGETSGVIKTEYGYHIVQVLAHEDAHLKTFDEVKPQLMADWKKTRVSQLMQQISDQAQAALQKDPQHPEKVAEQFHMQMVKADGVAPGKPVPEIGVNNDFDQSLAGLQTGQVSQAVALPGDKLAMAVVTGIIPAKPSTLDEVQSQVKDTLAANKLKSIEEKHARELMDKAKADGGDLAKAAKSMGLELKTSDDFTRSGAIEGVGSANYFQAGFTQPDGSTIGPVGMADGSWVVAKVVTHVPADMSQLESQRASIRDEIKSQRARDRAVLFDSGVREELKRQGKLKYHQDVIDQLMLTYKNTNSQGS